MDPNGNPSNEDRTLVDHGFAGCPGQLPRFFNSKPYIVHSALTSKLHPWLAADLPYSQALLDVVDIACPPRSLLNSEPPAPIGAAHMDATGAAISAAMQCLLLALGASPEAAEHRLLSAQPSLRTRRALYCSAVRFSPAAGVLWCTKASATESRVRTGRVRFDFCPARAQRPEIVRMAPERGAARPPPFRRFARAFRALATPSPTRYARGEGENEG